MSNLECVFAPLSESCAKTLCDRTYEKRRLAAVEIEKFVNYFRLNKNGFKYILEKIEGHLKMPVNSVSVLPVIKLAAVLRFLADGSYQKGVGNDFNVGVAQSTFSKILKQVLNVLVKEICSEFIKFPESVQEKEEIKLSFYTKYGFPGLIGCVDGTPHSHQIDMPFNKGKTPLL